MIFKSGFAFLGLLFVVMLLFIVKKYVALFEKNFRTALQWHNKQMMQHKRNYVNLLVMKVI